ncbi:MAG: restriction endonuclease subunit S [Candidatus Manganitrophaceae bacterium]
MASEWREESIGELAEIYDGPHATPPKTSDGPVFLGISNLAHGRIDLANSEHLSEDDYRRWTRRVEPQEGDVVFSYETRLGEAAIIPRGLRCCLGRRMGLLRARPGKVDRRFLMYAYLGPQFQETLRSRTIHGSTVDRIPLIEMSSFPMEVPTSFAEQRAIAHILGTLDDKIELNRRMNETLEAMARALFKSWFVDFDPVRAKAEGRDSWPTDPGLPKPLADLFPDSFEDSELGEIPRGWRLAPLPEVIDVNPTRSLRKGVEAPYLDMANMPTRGHSPDTVVDRPFGSGMRFQNGDTLVARITPCLENGKTAFVNFLKDGQVGWGSTEYIVLRPKPPLPEELAYCLARSTEFRDFAIQSMTGSSGRQRVPAESLSHFRLVAPPKPIAEHFGQIIKPLFERASAAAKESRTLAALRDVLLPKLISGELRVEDAERFVLRICP